jgi:hypothetical protein
LRRKAMAVEDSQKVRILNQKGLARESMKETLTCP